MILGNVNKISRFLIKTPRNVKRKNIKQGSQNPEQGSQNPKQGF